MMSNSSWVADFSANIISNNSTTLTPSIAPNPHLTGSKLDTLYIFLFLIAAAIMILSAPMAFRKCKECFCSIRPRNATDGDRVSEALLTNV